MANAANWKGPMKSATPPEDGPLLVEAELERRRRQRDAAARRRLSDRLLPGLPMDADAPETRVAVPRVGSLLDALVAGLTEKKEPFFDMVLENWKTICPDFPGRPGRFQDNRLFLYVRTSGQVFSLRTRLPKIRKLVAALPGAPKRFTVHLEVHAGPKVG